MFAAAVFRKEQDGWRFIRTVPNLSGKAATNVAFTPGGVSFDTEVWRKGRRTLLPDGQEALDGGAAVAASTTSPPQPGNGPQADAALALHAEDSLPFSPKCHSASLALSQGAGLSNGMIGSS